MNSNFIEFCSNFIENVPPQTFTNCQFYTILSLKMTVFQKIIFYFWVVGSNVGRIVHFRALPTLRCKRHLQLHSGRRNQHFFNEIAHYVMHRRMKFVLNPK